MSNLKLRFNSFFMFLATWLQCQITRYRSVLSNQQGNVFVENGLWLIIAVLALAVAVVALVAVIVTKYTAIGTQLTNVTVPTLH